ncbi:hypothetical protein BD560DRAFT_451365 [Blakeslea trispora]|nr:hypothetical protein BD560DRAFT_451365 [Blakeslea trispora]
MSSKQNNASASKKIRMTMACERCRSKKVKCDFAHPQCGRCQQAKVECSYDGSATQIDLFNLVKLNETVDLLQKRVQSIESDIKDVCSNTQYVADEIRVNRESSNEKSREEASISEESLQQKHNPAPVIQRNKSSINRLMAATASQWSLSLTPKGLRIDTNIASLHDLYDTLLSGMSQFDFPSNLHDPTHLDTSSQSSSSSASGADSPNMETVTLKKRKPLWKTRIKAFPLYSSWEPDHHRHDTDTKRHDTQQDYDIKAVEDMPHETLKSMINIYDRCFLCFPCYNPNNSVAVRFENGTLDPLLANSIFAWTARHAAIYHNLFPGKDPNQVGHSFFLKAKSLVKERFMKTSVDTMHSLLIMYIYAIGIPSRQKVEVESEAYIYLGLAIRMCLDLKMNMESKSKDIYEQESHRRFFWSLHFLETLGSIHSDRPFALPPDNTITTAFPTVMKHEEEGEKKYQVEFMIQRYKITRIYRDIIWKTTEEKPLFSQISALDKQLQNWHQELPSYLKFKPGDIHRRNWSSTSFKEQGCIKLNFEYNFQLCQLYSLFLSRPEDINEENSTVEVLSRDICYKAANNTVELLECWNQLRQLWCHFSLETLMMTTYIYGSILSQPEKHDPHQEETIKNNLKKMANILSNSPVRHHHYVITLISRIKSVFKDTLNMDLHIESVCHQGPSSQNNVHSTTAGDAVQMNLSTQVPCSSHPAVHSYTQPNLSAASSVNTSLSLGSDQFNPRVLNFFDTHPPASHFDMHFSDFVYTPVLDCAGSIDQANIITADTSKYTQHDKKPFHSCDFQDHQFEQTHPMYHSNISSPQPNATLHFHNRQLHHSTHHHQPQHHSHSKQNQPSPLASSSWVPLHPSNASSQPNIINRSPENYCPPHQLNQYQAPLPLPSESPSQHSNASNRAKQFYHNYDNIYYQ